jgi:RimJ/RimL family protein N-acetyltransferase
MTVLETPRLRLRRMTAEDAAFMLALLNEPSFIRNIGDRGVRTIEDARGYLAKGALASYEKFGFGLYAVESKEGGAPMGICGLVKRDILEIADLGYAFLPAYWSRGYAIESAAGVVEHAAALGMKRLAAVVNPDNDGSIRLLEKLGFAYERMIRMAEGEPEIKLFARDL